MPFNCDSFLEVKDSIFIKGLPTNANIKSCDVRTYFQERVGECSVLLAPVSKDKKWLFVALKFKSATVAETVIARYNGKCIFGHRVLLSYWRAPRNTIHTGRPHQNPDSNNRSLRWESRDHVKDKTEVSARSRGNVEYSRERGSECRKPKPGETVHYDEKDSFRGHHERKLPGRYDANKHSGYHEETEKSLQDYWDSDGPEGAYYDENMTDWDSDYNCGTDNLSERHYFDRGEEHLYYHKVWREGDVDSDQDFIDRTGQRDYKTNYPEVDMDREFYYELHESDVREEYVEKHCDYLKRSSQQIGYRTEGAGVRKGAWHDTREHSKMEGIQNRSQGNVPSRFSSFDQTDQQRRWEAAAPGKLIRRRLSDPDVLRGRPIHTSRGQDLEDQRSSNLRKDLTSRTVGILADKRPRSDEWLKVSQRNSQDKKQGRRSASPVNLRSKTSSRPGTLLVEIRNRLPEALDNRSPLDRPHGNNFAGSTHGRRSNSPVREKSTAALKIKRSSSSERGCNYARYDASPHRDRVSHSSTEQSTTAKQIAGRSFSPRGRHSDKGHHGKGMQRSSSKKDSDLRRSLILHHQRKHLSLSVPRIKAVSERGKQSSTGELNKSSSSHSSSESSSPTKKGNRKRRHNSDQKIKENIDAIKKRRPTDHHTSSRSDAARRKSETPRNKESKTTNESKRSPQKQKRSTREPRPQVSVKSSTGRADRLLHDLAASLAEDNISLRRPGLGAVGSKEGTIYDAKCVERMDVESLSDLAVRSEDDHKHCLEEDGQLVCSNEGVPLVDQAECDWETEEEAFEEEITGHVNTATQLGVSYDLDNSVPDMNNAEEVHDSTDLSAENYHSCHFSGLGEAFHKRELECTDISFKDQDFATIDENATFIVNDFEETDELEWNEFTSCQKMSETKVIRQLAEVRSKTENLHVVDMEYSSENTSPDVSQSRKVFCYPGDSNYTRKEIDDVEDTNCNVGDISFTDSGSELHDTEPISCCDESSHLTDNLKQGAYNVAIKTFELASNSLNNAGSCPLDTKPSVCKFEVGSISNKRMKLGSSNMAVHNYDNNLGRKLGVFKTKEIGAFYTEQELSSSSSSFPDISPGEGNQEIKELGKEASFLKRCDYNTQEIDDKRDGKVEGNSETQITRELDDALSDARYQEKDVLPTGEVTPGESCHGIENSHVYTLNPEGSKMKDAKLSANNREEVIVVGSTGDMQKEVSNREGISCVCQTEEVHGTEDDVKVISTVPVVSDTDEGIWRKKEGKISNNSKNERQSEQSADFDENDQVEICGDNASDAMYNNKGNEDSLSNTADTASNSKNGRYVMKTEDEDLLRREITDNTRFVGILFRDECIREDRDCYTSNNDHKCNDERQVFANNDGDSVMQKGFDLLSKALGEVNGHVTQQKMGSSVSTPDSKVKKSDQGANKGDINMSSTKNLDLNIDSCVMDHGDVITEEFFKTAVASHATYKRKKKLNTNDAHLSANVPEKKDTSKTFDAGLDGAGTSCTNEQGMQNGHHLVHENFEQVDMEISDDEHQLQSSCNSAVRVDDKDSARYIDVSTPYSPSSPTWKSDDHCSPPAPKDDSSPYSPSHPTNVSEGDLEHNNPAKELCYDEQECEPREDCTERREEISTDGCENCFMCSEVGKKERNANITPINQIMNSNGGGATSGDSTSTKSTSGSLYHVPLVKGTVSVDMPVGDLAQGEKNDNECSKDCSKDCSSAASVDNSVADGSIKDAQKPLMRCPRRSQSLPSFASVTPKPKVEYIIATKTKQFPIESGSQNKIQIFHDKTVPKLPSLDQAPGNQSAFVGPTTESQNGERLSVSEVELRSFSKVSSGVDSLLTERYYSSDPALKQNEATPVCNLAEDHRVKEAVHGSVRVSPTSLTVASHVNLHSASDEESVDKETNNNQNGKKCHGIPSTSKTSNTVNGVFLLSSVSKTTTKYSQAPLKSRLKKSRGATIPRTRNKINELPVNCSFSAEKIGPVRVPVTSEKTENGPLSFTFGNDSSQAPLLENETCTEGPGPDDNGGKAAGELDKESSCSASERSPQKLNSSSGLANKRRHIGTSNEASHTCKVPRKPLRLIIPTNQVPGRGGKKTVHPGRKYTKSTHSCTITSADLDLVSGSNGLERNQSNNSVTEDILVVTDSGNLNGNKMTTLASPSAMTNPSPTRSNKTTLPRRSKCMGKNSFLKVSRCDLKFASGDSLSLHEHNTGSEVRLKDNKPDDVDGELLTFSSPQSNCTNDSDSAVLCQSDGISPATINMSPLSEHLVKLNQHNPTFPTEKESVKAKGDSADCKASCIAKESDWIASKMERLRKKKEEIEQVYKQDCQTVIRVVKMLVSKDPRLESVLQNAVRHSLQEMGQKCVQELEKQIRPAT